MAATDDSSLVARLAATVQPVTTLGWVAIVLTAVTGVIHLALGIDTVPSPLGVASVLAAGGFAGAIVLYLMGYWRRVLLVLGVPFVGSQIVLWYLLNEPTSLGDISLVGGVDKVVQTVLIVLYVLMYQRES